MQLRVHLADRVVDQLVALACRHLLGHDVLGRTHGNCNRLVTNFLDSIGLCRTNLVFSRLNAARNGGFQIGLGLLSSFSGFILGMGHDAVGLRLHFFLLALIAGQQRLRFFTQRARLLQFGFDAFGALVQFPPKKARNLEVEDDADEHQKPKQNHEVGIAQRKERAFGGHCGAGHAHGGDECDVSCHIGYPLIRALIAAVTDFASALPPIALTNSLAVSLATSVTLSMALARISAIFFSPSAALAAISASALAVASSRSALISALV